MNEPIKIEETREWPLIWLIYQDPSICDRVTNDAWGALDELTRKSHVKLIVENLSNHTFLVWLGDSIAGCFVLQAKEGGIYEIHTLLHPDCRGRAALKAAREAMKMAFAISGVEKLVSYCPDNLPGVYLFARLCGLKAAGIAAVDWVKNGISYHMKLVELTKQDAEVLCH
jgi:hypothetical protein